MLSLEDCQAAKRIFDRSYFGFISATSGQHKQPVQ